MHGGTGKGRKPSQNQCPKKGVLASSVRDVLCPSNLVGTVVSRVRRKLGALSSNRYRYQRGDLALLVFASNCIGCGNAGIEPTERMEGGVGMPFYVYSVIRESGTPDVVKSQFPLEEGEIIFWRERAWRVIKAKGDYLFLEDTGDGTIDRR